MEAGLTPDPNKAALYRMEQREFAGLWMHVRQPMKYLQRRARAICRMYEVPPAKIRARTEPGCDAQYHDHCDTIDLGKTGRNVLSLAHELAHHIVWKRHGNRAQDHGPMFVLVYGQLLSSLRCCPMAGWRAACKRHRVKIAARKFRAAKQVSDRSRNAHR